MSKPQQPLTTSEGDWEKSAENSARLLDAISRAQEHYISRNEAETFFPRLLEGFIELTGSAGGFMGRVWTPEDGVPELDILAVSAASGDELCESVAGPNLPTDMRGITAEDWMQAVLNHRKPLIATDTDPGLPVPPLPHCLQPATSVLVLPVLNGRELVGVVAAVNREGGYDASITEFLKPLLRTYGQLFRAYESDRESARQERQFTAHRERLERQVADRARTIADQALVINAIHNAIITTDESLRVVRWNVGAEVLLGWTSEEACGQRIDQLLASPGEDGENLEQLRQGRQQEFETAIRRADDSTLHVHVSCSIAQDHDGESQLILVLIDRSREIEAHTRVAESEARYRTLFNLSPDAIATIRNGRYVDCNQATLELFGLDSYEQLNSVGIGALSPPMQPDGRDSAVAATEYFKTCLEKGRIWFDWYYRSLAGREFPARVFLQPVAIGDVTLIQAVIRDISHEVEAERRLQAHREYLEAVLEGSPTAIMVTDIESGAVRLANASARAMLGVGDEDVQSLNSNELWVDDVERTRLLDELRRDGLAQGETTLRRPDGSEFEARVDWQFNPGSEREILCWSVDITEQRDVLNRLHHQERMLQSIVDHLPVALFCKDINDGFRYTLCNRKCEELYGWPSEEVVGRNDFELAPAHVALRYREEDLEIAETAQPLVIPEDRISSATGETLYGHTIKIAIPDSRGQPSLIVGICEDVTERREAAQALHSSERRFRELAEHAPVGIFLTDPRGSCIFVNEAWQQSTGLSQEDAIGDGWLTALHPDDRAEKVERWRAFVGGTDSFDLEYRFQHADGRTIWVSGNAVPFRNDAGQTIGYLGTTTDITERKRVEAELQKSRDEAHRANQAKSEFLSRMSHELRTPLNAVLGFGQLLQMGSENFSDSQIEGVDQILAGGEHLLQLIDDVLDYSRIETGHMNLGIQRVDTAEPLERALSLVRSMAEHHDIQLHPPEGPSVGVMADPRRLQQILVNLLSNAIKYNRPGGRVEILQESLQGGMVRISVRDTGTGIRGEDQDRLFEPFERVLDASRLIEGTGIGLSICKRLVELMGGRIAFESESGVGSVFWIDLPAAESEQEDDSWLFGTLDSLVDATDLEGLRILYIEDHLASIHFMYEITRRVNDSELLTATNAIDGIALAKSARPDVILMDLNMPGLSGFQALEALRSDERTQDIPVIALSANATAETSGAVEEAGFTDFVLKPLRLGNLFESVSAAVRSAQAATDENID
ncbi:PAS domain S-box protein [Elongatibacter sediminis]|uniref:histidine kinase n=1 Tax=Elongatibacter sediminis TaxID=3119006 RepID=A0AAW9RLQ7_9GAMM